MSSRTLGVSGGALGLIASGSYTGDGNATQAIVGLGFTPRYVTIYARINADATGIPIEPEKITNDGLNTFFYWSGGVTRYLPNVIVSLDADGFTVALNWALVALNTLGQVYSYLAIG